MYKYVYDSSIFNRLSLECTAVCLKGVTAEAKCMWNVYEVAKQALIYSMQGE